MTLVKNNEKYSKFKIGDIVKIWKYKSIFSKDYTPNCKNFVIKKYKNSVLWTYFINGLNGKKIVGTLGKLQQKQIK